MSNRHSKQLTIFPILTHASVLILKEESNYYTQWKKKKE